MTSQPGRPEKIDIFDLIAAILFGVTFVLVPVALRAYPVQPVTRVAVALVPLVLMLSLTVLKSCTHDAFPDWEGAQWIPDGLGMFPFLYVLSSLIVRRRYS
ncbi:MAG TPA: hypothetical protein VGR15_04980 [Bacteroidota bacterium]|nr:hypothetical protein [Bacteroidota bacterium]